MDAGELLEVENGRGSPGEGRSSDALFGPKTYLTER